MEIFKSVIRVNQDIDLSGLGGINGDLVRGEYTYVDNGDGTATIEKITPPINPQSTDPAEMSATLGTAQDLNIAEVTALDESMDVFEAGEWLTVTKLTSDTAGLTAGDYLFADVQIPVFDFANTTGLGLFNEGEADWFGLLPNLGQVDVDSYIGSTPVVYLNDQDLDYLLPVGHSQVEGQFAIVNSQGVWKLDTVIEPAEPNAVGELVDDSTGTYADIGTMLTGLAAEDQVNMGSDTAYNLSEVNLDTIFGAGHGYDAGWYVLEDASTHYTVYDADFDLEVGGNPIDFETSYNLILDDYSDKMSYYDGTVYEFSAQELALLTGDDTLAAGLYHLAADGSALALDTYSLSAVADGSVVDLLAGGGTYNDAKAALSATLTDLELTAETATGVLGNIYDLTDHDLDAILGNNTHGLSADYYAILDDGSSSLKIDSVTWTVAPDDTSPIPVTLDAVEDYIFGPSLRFDLNVTDDTSDPVVIAGLADPITFDAIYAGPISIEDASADHTPIEVKMAIAAEQDGNGEVSYIPADTDLSGLASMSFVSYWEDVPPMAPPSGEFFALADADDGASDGVLYGDDTAPADGNYIILEQGGSFYGFEVTGTGDIHDPYEIQPGAYEFTDMTERPTGAADGTTEDPVGNVFDLPHSAVFAGSGDDSVKTFAWYEENEHFYAIEVVSDGGQGYYKADGAERSIGYQFEGMGLAIDTASSIGTIADAANLRFAPAPIEVEDFYALTVADHGVSEDGNYVVRETKAYKVDGNAQTGYTVSDTAEVSASDGSVLNFAGDYTDLEAGELSVQIVTLAAEDGGVTAGGNYALIDNGRDGYDAYAVSPYGATGHFSVALTPDSVDAFTYENMETANFPVAGYLSDRNTPAVSPDEQIFEVVRVDAERYGNIITYGIKVKDDIIADESITLTSGIFNLYWDATENDKGDMVPSYSFWGGFDPLGGAPKEITRAEVPEDSEAPATFFSTLGGYGISFGMFNDEGMTFSKDTGGYVATFMLNKDNADDINNFHLTTSQYSLYDAYDTTHTPPSEQPAAVNEIGFNFAEQTIAIDVATSRGEAVNNVEALVTSLSTNDGLSIVPVAKHGDFIQYQLVMNVAIPDFMKAYTPDPLNDGEWVRDENAAINPDHKITISGMNIFDKSVTWLTDLIDSGEGSSLLASTTKSVTLDGNAATVKSAAAATYTGHEFFDIMYGVAMNPTMDNISRDLKTSSELVFELKDLLLPTLADGTNPKDAEGRYILAEFTAQETRDDIMSFQASQGGSDNSGYEASAERTITRNFETDFATFTDTIGGVTTEIEGITSTDGSEVVVLGDGFYLNERDYDDAIGAEDALGALRVSRDVAAQVTDNIYSQSEIIAADFNLDGKVSSADAYDILQYAVGGPAPGGGTAKWVYIDDLGDNEATPSSVTYDHVTDTFVGSTVTIDATAVLIGDVTSSYTGAGRKLDYLVEMLDDATYDATDAEVVSAVAIDGKPNEYDVTLTDASKDGVIYINGETGIYHVDGLTSEAEVIVSEETYNFIDEGSWGEDRIIANPLGLDGEDVVALPEFEGAGGIRSMIDSQLDGGEDVAYVYVTQVVTNGMGFGEDDVAEYIAVDMNMDGVFEADKDLMIVNTIGEDAVYFNTEWYTPIDLHAPDILQA